MRPARSAGSPVLVEVLRVHRHGADEENRAALIAGCVGHHRAEAGRRPSRRLRATIACLNAGRDRVAKDERPPFTRSYRTEF